ncbi:hypothetical protein Hanom_Chr12g01125901 [Helianthus anomalus]
MNPNQNLINFDINLIAPLSYHIYHSRHWIYTIIAQLFGTKRVYKNKNVGRSGVDVTEKEVREGRTYGDSNFKNICPHFNCRGFKIPPMRFQGV